MARLVMCGFESGSIDELLPHEGTAGRLNIQTDDPRTGTFYGRINPHSAGNYWQVLIPSKDEIFFRIAFRRASDHRFFFLRFIGPEGTMCWIGNDGGEPNLSLVVSNVATADPVATATLAYPGSEWVELQGRLLFRDDATGRTELWQDGIKVMDYTGPTNATTNDACSVLRIGSNASGAGGAAAEAHFDDIVVDDAELPPRGGILALFPDAAGDSTQLTPDSGANWDRVNDHPPEDDDSYVESDTAGDKDLYNVEASVFNDAIIHAVQVVARARTVDGTGTAIKALIKTGSTEHASNELPLIEQYRYRFGDIHPVNPSTTSAWTVSDLDTLQIGVSVE